MATHSMREPAGALHHVGRFIPVHRKARGAEHPPLREAAPHPPYADTCPQERDSAETENPVQAAESHLTQTTKTPTGRDPVRVTRSAEHTSALQSRGHLVC